MGRDKVTNGPNCGVNIKEDSISPEIVCAQGLQFTYSTSSSEIAKWLKRETQSLRQRQMYPITWRIVVSLPALALLLTAAINDIKCNKNSLESFPVKR